MTRTTPVFAAETGKEAADWLGVLKPPRVPAVPVLRGRKAADPEAWELARDAGVGASDIGVIMGVSTFSSRYALWWQKHLHWRLEQNEAMADGHAHEDMVVREFAQRHPELFVAKPAVPLWAHPEHPWAVCTPDYLAVQVGEPLILTGVYTEGDARELRTAQANEDPARRTAPAHVVPVELKWDASPGWGPSGSDQVPATYRLQVMWQAWIFGAPGGWLVRRSPTGRNRYREYWIPRDDDLIGDAITAGASFIASLETGVSPDPDGSAATAEMLQVINPAVVPGKVATVPPALAEAWELARDGVRAAEAMKRTIDNQLREVIGDAERVMTPDGRVFAERKIGKRAGYEVAPAVVDQLRRVSDGPRDEGGSVPAADGAAGDDPGAGAAGSEEALAGGADGVGDGPAGTDTGTGAGPDGPGGAPGSPLPGVRGDDRPQDGLLEELLADGRMSITDLFLLREAEASVAMSRDSEVQTYALPPEQAVDQEKHHE